MKKILSIIYVLQLITSPIAFSQESKDITEVALMKSSNNTIGLLLGESTNKAIQIFGQPTSISDFYSEMAEETLKVYNYGQDKLYFSNGKLQSYELRQKSDISVGKINGISFKIGDKITVTETIDPNFNGDRRHAIDDTEITYSFHDYPLLINEWKKFDNISYRSISTSYLKTNGIVTDCIIQLLFDSNNILVAIDIADI
jgi:hypothetical protein